MSRRRIITIAIALALGAIASFVSFQYANGADSRAYSGTQLVTVFRLKEAVPKGTPAADALQRDLFEQIEVPVAVRPLTAVPDPSALSGRIALADIAAKQFLVEGMFVAPDVARTTSADRIPKGHVAVTVSVSDIQGVAGLVQPGDHVNIMVGVEGVQRLLYQNVQVLFIGMTPAPAPADMPPPGSPQTPPPPPLAPSNLVTFAVPAAAATKISFAASQTGGVYLALVPPGYQPVPSEPVNSGNLFSGPLTPEG